MNATIAKASAVVLLIFYELHDICVLYTQDMGQVIQIGKRIFSMAQAAASQFGNSETMNCNFFGSSE